MDNGRDSRNGSGPADRQFLLIPIAVFALVVAGGLGYFFMSRPEESKKGDRPQSKALSSEAARNRDYFEIVSLTCQQNGQNLAKAAWLAYKTGSGALDEIEDFQVRKHLDREHERIVEGLEADQLRLRKSFLENHKVDSKDWDNTFAKTFPEQNGIGEDVAKVVKPICEKQMKAVSEQPAQARVAFMTEKAGDFAQEPWQAVKQLPSLSALRQKVWQSD